MEKTLFGNGDRSKAITYIVEELCHRKRDWPIIAGYIIGILTVLASIWAN